MTNRQPHQDMLLAAADAACMRQILIAWRRRSALDLLVQPLEGLAGQILFQWPTGNGAKAVVS